MTVLSETRLQRIRELLDYHRSFRFCGPSDDPEEITAVTLGYRDLVVQLQRLATPILAEPAASILNSLEVEVLNLFSAFDAHSEIEAMILDIEEAIDSATSREKPASLSATASTKSLERLFQENDLEAVEAEFTRCMENLGTDPPVAITAACSMLESLYKAYIEDNNIAMPSKQSIGPLWKVVSRELGFDPSAVEDNDVKKILSGLTSINDGIGSLRTHTGSAHGRGRKSYGVQPRHARLAIHASHTLVGFVLETWEHRNRASLLKQSS